MNLKDFLTSRDKPPELYWSLVIEEGWVQAGIWYIADSVSEVVSVSPGAKWEVEEELIGAVDAALSSSIQKLPENYEEPSKTVFGVPSSWTKNGEIAEEFLGKIKKICTELSLTPVGFVVLPEAIAHLYKSEEGSPVSAIILGLDDKSLEISVFKLGNLIGTTQVARSVSLVEDIVEGLSRFDGASPLPSRFILFDGKEGELDEAKESLMQADWEKDQKIKFLHTPKVEILTPDRKVLATALAGGAEIGNAASVAAKDETKEEIQEVPEQEPQEENLAAEDMGFVVGKDISQNAPMKVAPPPLPQPSFTPPKEPVLGKIVDKTKSLFHGFSARLSTEPAAPRKFSKKSAIGMGVALGILLTIFGLFWWFYPKAEVLVYVSPKKFEQESEIAFDSANSRALTVEVSGDKTKATTGNKTVGEKAKGSVQIRNGTAFPINLNTGATIVSSGNLKFNLDNEASVSAALSPSSPGTATVSVTADTIGAEYNLAKDEIFRVGNYPKAEVDATSTGDFSGGSSREISAVDASDHESLLTQLTDELSGNARQELSGEVSDDQIFVNDLASLETSSETYDHKVGDEADSVKLSLTLDTTGIAADKEKLLAFAREILKDKVPSGYVLRDSQIDFKFTFVDQDGETFNYKVVVSANFLPEVNIDSIKKQIAGKTVAVTESYLTSIPGFTGADVTLSPRLPGIFGTIPHVRKNITVEVAAER